MMLDDLVLATGSGFLWKKGETLGVVTAWHCLTGTHPETRQSLNPGKAARPNKIAVSLLMSDMGEGTITIWLHNQETGDPVWYVHPLGSRELALAVIWVLRADLSPAAVNLPGNSTTYSPIVLPVNRT